MSVDISPDESHALLIYINELQLSIDEGSQRNVVADESPCSTAPETATREGLLESSAPNIDYEGPLW